jgi:hypothetical protein
MGTLVWGEREDGGREEDEEGKRPAKKRDVELKRI